MTFCLAALLLAAGDPPFSADRIKADVVYLSSDRLEGRGPGTRGEELATDHLAAEFSGHHSRASRFVPFLEGVSGSLRRSGSLCHRRALARL